MTVVKRVATRPRAILLAGLVVREVFSFWTGSSFDFELWVRTGYWVAHGVSPYGAIPPAPGLSFEVTSSLQSQLVVAYLPFWPLLLAGIYDLYSIVGFGDRFVYYFLVKQPIIFGDVLLGYVIFAYLRKNGSEAAEDALVLWLFSPYTILVSGIWGTFDSLAMLPLVLALLIIQKESGLGSILEGLSIWMKSIPLIYAIPLSWSGRGRRRKLRNLAFAIFVPAAGTIVPIVLLHWQVSTALQTLNSTVVKGGQSMSIVGTLLYIQDLGLVTGWPGWLLQVLGIMWIPAVLFATALAWRWFGFSTEKGIVKSLLLCTIVFLIFRAQINEQHAIYPLALALLEIYLWSPGRRWLYFAITATVVIYMSVNYAVLVSFPGPLYPQAVQIGLSLGQSWGWARTVALMICSFVFTGLCVSYFYLLAMDRRHHR